MVYVLQLEPMSRECIPVSRLDTSMKFRLGLKKRTIIRNKKSIHLKVKFEVLKTTEVTLSFAKGC